MDRLEQNQGYNYVDKVWNFLASRVTCTDFVRRLYSDIIDTIDKIRI